MTGRGRPRKAAGPDTDIAKSKTRAEETKQKSCLLKNLTEEEQNDTTKEQKPKGQKKNNHTEEKPSVQKRQKEKPEIDKRRKSGGKAKSQEMPPEEMTEMQPDTAKVATKHLPKTTKGKTHGRKEKLELQCAEKPRTAKDTTPDSEQVAQEKTSAELPNDIPIKAALAKPKLPGKCVVKPKTLKANTKATAVDPILLKTLEKLKIKRNDRSEAAQAVNKITAHITTHLKKNTECFKTVEPLRTGSYYENLKIDKPDEFDVMLVIPVERVNIEPFGDDGAFYSVGLKRGKSPLEVFQEGDTLSASRMLNEFREEVKKSVKEFKGWEVTKKKKGCPAVTMTTQVQSTTISLDVVLSLKVKSSWPTFTNEGLKIEDWLGTKVKQQYKREAYYLVPKYEGRGTVESGGVLAKDVWRISFSHIEKAILMNHGSEKTCCEEKGARCCRKDCLKLLKHLLSLLKEKDSSFDKFYSYHAKTTLLHACSTRTKDTEWSASNLSHCFQLLLEDFEARVEEGVLNNFFVPNQNLLSGSTKAKCKLLAHSIREERDNGFPIFK